MTTPLKVLYITAGRSFFSKNLPRKIQGILDCWRKMGVDVLHISGGEVSDNSVIKTPDEYGAMNTHNRWYRSIRILRPLVISFSEKRDIEHDKKMASHLDHICKEFKPDLIWERSSRLHRAGLEIAQKLNLTYVLEWKDHLVDYSNSIYRKKALNLEFKKNFKSDYLVVESNELKYRLTQEGIEGAKIVVAHNAVDSEEFDVLDKAGSLEFRKSLGIYPDDVLIGYLGSYAFYHNTMLLIHAANLIRNANSRNNIKIVMVGAGKEYQESFRLATDLKLLNDVVIMKPGVSKKDVPILLRALDIAVLPGSTDIICPIKIQEYMSCGLPVVAPAYDCNREVIKDGVNGVLFSPESEEDLAKKILFLASDRHLRETLGVQARSDAVEFFSWEATWGAALKSILIKDKLIPEGGLEI